jgi:hypothetical protein
MKAVLKGSDEWSFEVECEHCHAQQVMAEGALFLVHVDGFPIALPSFVCGLCGKTTTLMSGEMPIHVYQRLPTR